MFNELEIMKTNILKNMKQYTKYICAVVLMLGMSISAWGVTITLKVWNHDTGAYVDYGTIEKGQQPGSEPDNDGWNIPTAWAPGEQCDAVHPGNAYAAYHGYYAWPTSNYNGESTILYAVYYYEDEDHNDSQYYYTTKPTLSLFSSCTKYDITPHQTGTGTVLVDASACEDVTVTFTATPGTGYAYEGATILGDVTDISLAAGDAKQFTMPGEDVLLSVTFTAQSYDATLKPNGGSGSDQVVRVTYGEIPPTTLKVGGGAVVIPTRTGYDFDGYYDVSASSGGTQYYSYKGNPKALAAENLWDKANDANLFARWIAHTLTITLDKGTGGTNDGTAVVDYGTDALGDIDHATNSTTGYHLDGYYTLGGTKILEANGDFAADNITSYISDGNWIYDDDVTLYAHWALNTYTVHFNKNNNDATGSMSDQEFTYGTAQNLTNCGFSLVGKVFDGWATSAGGEKAYNNGAEVNNLTTTNEATVNLFAKWRDGSYTDYVFSCAELTLTPKLVTNGTPVFITSAASKTVRSQDSILVVGNGLTPNTTLTYPGLPSKFAIKTRLGANLQTDVNGEINAVAYIFYTPDAGDETDGLDKLTGISVSVGGAKPITKNLTQDIIGRHLPADFVIAVKRNGKWYALPDTMTGTWNPKPVEIAVDNIDNPTIAYTASTNVYNLYGQVSETIGGTAGYLYSDGQMVKLGMKNNATYANYPLFGNATGTSTLGKGGTATSVTNNIGKQYWWVLTQTNTSITNPQDAKYSITCSNNTAPFVLKENAGNPQWGFFTTGSVGPIRLIPASDIPFTAASVVEWGQHSAIVEANPTAKTGIDATSVIAHLNGVSSSAIELAETKSSVKNGDSKYNYTVNFGDAIDFAAAASNGAMLTLEWKNGATVKAMSNIVVPKIIATSATMSSIIATDDPWSKAEVHVLPGVTLEANAGDFSSKDVVINQLEIYPGATVKVTKGAQDVGTLKVKTLVLRNGWTRVGEKAYDVARLYVPTDANLAKNANDNVWYSDWYIDYDQYYPIAVPFPVATSSIVYKNTSSAASAGVKLRYYSGELRAANVQENQAANWVEYTWGVGGTMPATLEPSKGYIMTAKRPTGKAFSIVRMPMTFSNDWTTAGEKGSIEVDEVTTHKDQVGVTAWGDENTPSYAKGWNIIANPYMSLHQGELTYTSGGGTIEYANIPNITFTEYDQLPIETTKLKPASAFLVQAPKDGTVTFGATNRKASAPSFRKEVQDEVLPTQKAYILLASDEAEDMMGILVSEKYSAEYEINADLEKLLGDGTSLRTHMHWNDMKMAYLAINQELAQEWIPVSVRIETEGEHTFSMHSASIVGELKSVYLTDYTTGAVTNLLEDSYSFYSTAGTINGRFAINAKIGERPTPTELDIIRDGNEGTGPIKFLYRHKVFILHQGMIYDATGKKVREIR